MTIVSIAYHERIDSLEILTSYFFSSLIQTREMLFLFGSNQFMLHQHDPLRRAAIPETYANFPTAANTKRQISTNCKVF